MERKELFRALFGSDNYDLSMKANEKLKIPASDKDYKVFLVPSFDDLYTKKEYSFDEITETVDLVYSDIRKLERVSTNLNWLEIFFSKEIIYNPTLSIRERQLLNLIFNMRHDIVRMNLAYFFDSCMGMHIERVKRLHKYSASCLYMKDLYGYNIKEALHAYRVPDTAIRFADGGFKDLGAALRYEGESKDFMMKIRHGEISEEVMIKTLDGIKNYANEKYQEAYHAFAKNEEVEVKLKAIIYELVKINVVKGE
jgi:DNA integrity scanning protein DisA with diadenylate cyclase activity